MLLPVFLHEKRAQSSMIFCWPVQYEISSNNVDDDDNNNHGDKHGGGKFEKSQQSTTTTQDMSHKPLH
jgi:hypothetical protein